MSIQEKLESVDDFLARIEDYAHGEEGAEASKCRGLLSEVVKDLPPDLYLVNWPSWRATNKVNPSVSVRHKLDARIAAGNYFRDRVVAGDYKLVSTYRNAQGFVSRNWRNFM
jgi:hypothetical protein